MSVEITFQDEGHSGLVAEGTYLWEAAKRLGVRLPAECDGRGECDTCAVEIVQGAELLSPATDAERKILAPERLGHAERLACQARVEKAGEVIVRPAPVRERGEQKDGGGQGFRKRFRDLSLDQKLGTLIELEAITITEVLNTARGKSAALVEKFLNLTTQKRSSKDKLSGKALDGNNK